MKASLLRSWTGARRHSRLNAFTIAHAHDVILKQKPSSLRKVPTTPLEQMKWKRMPFGISVAPEEFQRRIDENLEGLEGVKAIADDILIWGDEASHDKRLLALLERWMSSEEY